jgi:hypothetical protein
MIGLFHNIFTKNDSRRVCAYRPRSRRRTWLRFTTRRRRRVVSLVEFLVLCAALVVASLMAAGRFTLPPDAFQHLADFAQR